MLQLGGFARVTYIIMLVLLVCIYVDMKETYIYILRHVN